jgi:cation transport ATPase
VKRAAGTSSQSERGRASETPASLAAAVALALTGPLVTLGDLSLRFFLVEFGFARQHEAIVLAVGVVSCALALGACVGSNRLRKSARGRAREVEFMASLGVALAAFSAVVIVAALLPHAYFDGEGSP